MRSGGCSPSHHAKRAKKALPPPPDVAAADNAGSDPVMDIHPNARATGARRHWTPAEDDKLKNAVQIHGGKNWDAIAHLVSSRTNEQCSKRWHGVLDARIVGTTVRKGKWTPEEDDKLKDAVQMHGVKNWEVIARLVPGRMKVQCSRRWKYALDARIVGTTVRTGKWTPDEDDKLRNAVQMHDGKKWDAIACLVSGRTKRQCSNRWYVLDARIVGMAVRTGKWTSDEDGNLKNAVQIHGSKNWDAIVRLVPGRTSNQCHGRWNYALNPSIVLTTWRTGKWTEDEDARLKDAVQMHGGKDWSAIAALVTGRAKVQCRSRWHQYLEHSIHKI
jgi:hypothetical protein